MRELLRAEAVQLKGETALPNRRAFRGYSHMALTEKKEGLGV